MIGRIRNGKTGRWEPRLVNGSDCDASTFGMYTGVKDQNGKLIYEGDCVRYSRYGTNTDEIYIVERRCYGMVLKATERADEIRMDTNFIARNGKNFELEVVGNAYDYDDMETKTIRKKKDRL